MSSRRLPKPFDAQEIRALERAAGDRPDVRAAMTFLRETGLRISEAISIPRAQAQGWPSPRKGVARWLRHDRPVAVRIIGKGDKERTVVLTREAIAAGKLLAAHSKGETMWPWTARGTRWLFDQVGRRAGVHCHPHRWRHTYVSELIEAGVPVEIVADMAGHSAVDITRLYWSASTRAKVDALRRRHRYLRSR